MLQLELRDKNYIVTCTSPGKVKTPLKGRRGSSLYHHSPLDFLLASLGTCSGGEIVDYCKLNDLDVETFESITIALIDDIFTIHIKYPKFLEEKHRQRMTNRLENCTVSEYLSKDIEIKWEESNIPIEEIEKRERKGCCGQ